MDRITVTDVRSNLGDSAFLLDDGKVSILYDSGFGFTGHQVARNIEKVLQGRNLDYIFLTHSHYDHALGSAYIRRHFPDVKVVAHEYAAYVFTRPGAIETMRKLDSENARQNGIEDYEFLGNELRVDLPVKDGDVIQAGDLTFEVLGLPGHTRCSVGYYCKELDLLLSSETLGVYDGNSTITASFLVGYESSMKAIDRVLARNASFIVSPHLGLLDPEQTQFYLCNIKKANQDVARFLLTLAQEGKSNKQIVEIFKQRFWHGYIKDIYPNDALELNTTIMIELLKRENPTF